MLLYFLHFWCSEEMLFGYVRATLDLQGTDVLHPALHNVLAAGGELHTLSLEVLLIVHSDLENTKDLPWI